jgi:hypothetical protein
MRVFYEIINIDRYQKGGEGIERFESDVFVVAIEGLQGLTSNSAFSVAQMRREEEER